MTKLYNKLMRAARINRPVVLIMLIFGALVIPAHVEARLHPPRVITKTYKEDIDGIRPFKCWRTETCWWSRNSYQAPKPYVVTNENENAREWYKRQRI